MPNNPQFLWLFVHRKHFNDQASGYLTDLHPLAVVPKTERFRSSDVGRLVLWKIAGVVQLFYIDVGDIHPAEIAFQMMPRHQKYL